MVSALALADPRHERSEVRTKTHGIDIAIVLDLSKSMLAEDVLPNRMEAAKGVIADFVVGRKGDRFALVAFAGKPFLLSPLTDSKETFAAVLSKISTDSIHQEIPGLSGTDIGDGLLLATDALSGSVREKTIVLVTDGEANVGVDPKPVAKFAADNGIKIFSVGIGDPKGIDLFVTDRKSGEKQYFIGPDGKPIHAVVDEELLKYLSNVSGGGYGLAKDAEALRALFKKIDEVTKRPVETVTEERFTDAKGPFLILLGCLLPVFAFLRGRGSENAFS